MMRNNKSFWLLVLFLGFFTINLSGQGRLSYTQAKALFGEQRILKFRQFSLELTDDSKEELKKLVDIIRLKPNIMHENMIVIQTFTCEKELKVKPYIAACRGQVVIDYLVEAIGMPRRKCLIQDGGTTDYDPNCDVAGSGTNLYLKPAWK